MKKLLLGTLLGFVAGTASANWEGGLSYAQMSDEVVSRDITLGAIVGHVGYANKMSDTVTFVPRVRLGFGVKDDTWDAFIPGASDVDISLSRFVAIDAKLQFQTSDNLYLYLMPSYANAKLSASALGSSVSEDEWDFGGGAGIGYHFNKAWAFEASYESFGGTDVVSFGINGRF